MSVYSYRTKNHPSKENTNKKGGLLKKLIAIIASLAAVGIILAEGGYQLIVDMFHKQDTKSDKNKASSSAITKDSATQFRITALNKVYNFVDQINSSRAVAVGDKKISFTMDEGVALFIFINNLTSEDIINLFGDYSINYEDLIDNYNNAMAKLLYYFAVSTQPSGFGDLFLDKNSKSKAFFEDFEQSNIEYNKLSPEDRVEAAKKIVDKFQSYYLDNSNSLSTNGSVTNGAKRSVLDSIELSYYIGWHFSTEKFPEDIHNALSNIKSSLCAGVNESAINSIKILTQLQASRLNSSNSGNEDSYSNLMQQFVDKLKTAGHDGNGPLPKINDQDWFKNFNGKVNNPLNTQTKEPAKQNTPATQGPSDNKGQVTQQEKNLTKQQIDGVVGNLPDNEKEQANSDLAKIQAEIDQQNKDQQDYGKGLADGGNQARIDFDNAVDKKLPLPTKKTDSSTDPYTKGYIEGYNNQITFCTNQYDQDKATTASLQKLDPNKTSTSKEIKFLTSLSNMLKGSKNKQSEPISNEDQTTYVKF